MDVLANHIRFRAAKKMPLHLHQRVQAKKRLALGFRDVVHLPDGVQEPERGRNAHVQRFSVILLYFQENSIVFFHDILTNKEEEY